jgi:hypothetical protein
MILPIFANVEWPSAIVASVLIVCLTAGFVAAVMRYNSDAAMKLAGYFTGFLGLLLGTIMTYFFTREATQQRYKPCKREVKLSFVSLRHSSTLMKLLPMLLRPSFHRKTLNGSAR